MTSRLNGPVPHSLEVRRVRSGKTERTPFKASERNAVLPNILAKHTS